MKTIPLRRVAECLDAARIPLNSEQRSSRLGEVAYWGANGIVDRLDHALFDEPLVLLGEDGAPFFDPAKSVAFFVDGPIWPNNHVHVLRARANADPRFITHALNTTDYRRAISGSTRDKLTQDDMMSIRIPHWAPDQQRRIADFLDDRIARIDQIITARETQLVAVREARLSTLDDVIRDSGPPQRLAWSLALGAVGVVVNPSTYFRDHGVPFVHGYNVRDGYLDLANLKLMSESDSVALGRSRLRANDVLVVRAGYPGRAAVVPAELEGGNCASVLLLRPGPALAPQWLATFLNSPLGKWQVERVQYGAAQGVINLSDVVSFSIPLPKREEQERRLASLRTLETQWQHGTGVILAQVARLHEYRQSLITAAVSGELDVSTAGSGIPG